MNALGRFGATVAAVVAASALAGPALAQGHFASARVGAHISGGARFSGGHLGGGTRLGGGARIAAPTRSSGFSSPHFGYGVRGLGSSAARAATPHSFAPVPGRPAVTPMAHGLAARPGTARPYGSPSGYGRWHGGYWRGRYWPPGYVGGLGLFLATLPVGCLTFWYGDVPYYYYDNAYYTWSAADSGYIATTPPPALDSASESGSAAAAPASTDQSVDGLFAYPRNGQSDEQQSTDKRECSDWAASQTTGGSGSSDYQRAVGACLEGRGYSVR